jgi:hypothetical protein
MDGFFTCVIGGVGGSAIVLFINVSFAGKDDFVSLGGDFSVGDFCKKFFVDVTLSDGIQPFIPVGGGGYGLF